MPDSCAKALAPTIALFGCTGKPVMPDTSFEAATICVVSMRVEHGKTSLRVFTAMTISSSEALPARSPRPLTVHSTWRAPCITADSELATAMPKSLWQCTDHTALLELGTRVRRVAMSDPNCHGVVYPTVSGMLIVFAPALIAASISRQRKSGSERPASSGENSTSAVYSRAHFTDLTACSRT